MENVEVPYRYPRVTIESPYRNSTADVQKTYSESTEYRTEEVTQEVIS